MIFDFDEFIKVHSGELVILAMLLLVIITLFVALPQLLRANSARPNGGMKSGSNRSRRESQSRTTTTARAPRGELPCSCRWSS